MDLEEVFDDIPEDELKRKIRDALFKPYQKRGPKDLKHVDMVSYYSENGEMEDGTKKYVVRDKVKDPCYIPEEGDEVRLGGRRENRGAEDYIVDEVNVIVEDDNHFIKVYLRDDDS